MINTWDFAVWGIGYLGYICLLTVIVKKKRYREFPWFTANLCNDMLQSVILLGAHVFLTGKVYFYIYWSFETLDAVLSVFVLIELARTLARKLPVAQKNSLKEFRATGLVMMALVLVCVWLWTPRVSEMITTIAFKLTVFSGLLLFALALAVFMVIFFYGVRFRVHAAVLIYGLLVYFGAKTMIFTAILFENVPYWWVVFERSIKPLYILCLFGWSLALWFDEPQRKLSAEMQSLVYLDEKLLSHREK